MVERAPLTTAQTESFRACLPELKPLLDAHWKELALFQNEIRLDPNYQTYFAHEDAGGLIFATVRKAGKIIAYYIGFIAAHPHYQSSLQCKLDIWRVVAEERGRLYERRLFKAVERELKRRRVQVWWNGEKTAHPCGRLYTAFGMEPAEVYYVKYLGDY